MVSKKIIRKDVDPIVKLGSQRGLTNPGQNGCLLLAPLKKNGLQNKL